jgi:phage gp29-like protein
MRILGKHIPFTAAGKPTPQPDMREQVRAVSLFDLQSRRYSNAFSELDPVLSRKGYEVYTRDMMADDQVCRCVHLLKLGVVVGGWSVAPAVGEGEEGYQEAQDIADFVEHCIDQMQGSLERVCMNIADAVVPGFSVAEINWLLFEGGPYDGMVGIDSIKPKPAATFTFDLDEFGTVKQLLQTIGTTREEPVALDKVLLYTYDQQATGLPQGMSALRAAHRHWWRKNSLMQWEMVAAEKHACPTPWGTYPKGTPKQLQDDLLKALESFQTDTAVITMEGATITLLEPKSSVMAPYEDGIASANMAIARAILGQTLAVEESTSGTGSYAQAKVHAGVLAMFLGGIRREIAEEVLKEQLVKRLVNYNFTTDLYPSIILSEPDERDLESLARVFDVLLKGGVVDPKEPMIREEFGLPPMPQELAEEQAAKVEAAEIAAEKAKEAAAQQPPVSVGPETPLGQTQGVDGA